MINEAERVERTGSTRSSCTHKCVVVVVPFMVPMGNIMPVDVWIHTYIYIYIY
jgi:hypothetical protein